MCGSLVGAMLVGGPGGRLALCWLAGKGTAGRECGRAHKLLRASLLQVLGFVTDATKAPEQGSGSGLWEAQAVLLLWLSILVLSPFDLIILDSSVTDSSGAAAAQARYAPLAARVMELCQGFLSQPGVFVGGFCWGSATSSHAVLHPAQASSRHASLQALFVS